MNKVIPFRGSAAAPSRAVRAANIKTMIPVRTKACRSGPVLVATWRRNPVNGRLECGWADRSALDEGVSRSFRQRQAA